MKKKILIASVIVTLIVFSLVFFPKKDSSYIRADESFNLTPCPFSKEYIAWLDLSESERTLTSMPNKCDYSKISDQIMKSSSTLDVNDPRILLPTYDLRNDAGKNYVTSIKDQGYLSGCWTFASLASLESHLLVKNKTTNPTPDLYNYSERHMEFATSYGFLDGINSKGYNRVIDTGGTIFTSASYLVNHQGPVIETDMPYVNEYPLGKTNLSSINKPVVADVNDLEFIFNTRSSCTINQVNSIKSRIVNFGAVYTSMYFDISYLNNYAYYYNGPQLINHAVNIIGWDDNYSATNFKVSNRPSSKGAWIIKNSYGSLFGQSGYFYISYEDINICGGIMSIRDADQTVANNHYAYDYLGWNTSYAVGAFSQTGFGANVYTRIQTLPELLKEVTIGTVAPTDYEIYINSVDGALTGPNVKLIQSGNIPFVGYGAVPLSTPITLNGTQFSVIVKFTTPGYYYPLPIQTNDYPNYEYSTIDAGKTFISNNINGPWRDLSVYSEKPIVSIKVETDTITNPSILIIGEFVYEKYGTVNDLLVRLNTDPKNVYTIYSQDGVTQLTTGLVQTSQIIKLNGTQIYRLIVIGDLNLDGEADIADIIRLSRHIVGLDAIQDNILIKAGDVNSDGDADIGDIIKISRYILKEADL